MKTKTRLSLSQGSILAATILTASLFCRPARLRTLRTKSLNRGQD